MKKHEIEYNFPFRIVSELARRESNAKRYYRPILTLHKWFARRLGSIFRAILIYAAIISDSDNKEIKTDSFWDLYLKEHEFSNLCILDPFMGGGTTIIEALRLGFNRIIGGDLNPVAWFTVKKEIDKIDFQAFQKEYQIIASQVEDDIRKYYKTECPTCQEVADVMYYFWIREIECEQCQNTLPLFRSNIFAFDRKNKTTPYLLCQKCNVIFLSNSEYNNECPECFTNINPRGYVVKRGRYFCTFCGNSGRIVSSNTNQGIRKERLYALEYYCPLCNIRDFKSTDSNDIQRFQDAEKEFETLQSTLPLPSQRIPPGAKTQELLNHQIYHFTDMFNKRQLLSLGKLLKVILEIQDTNLREFFLLTFSTALEYNNLLCEYHRKNHYVYNLFRKHAFPATLNPCENNPWGARFGTGTFKNFFKKTVKVKDYAYNPYEIYIDTEGSTQRIPMKQQIVADVTYDLTSTIRNNEQKVELYCHSSSHIDLLDESVDLVITDPPYYDNVQYAELADFYYVWLRLGLKDKYPWFESEYSPKGDEIVKNIKRGKDSESFQKALSGVFKEISRVLKRDGIFIFTFHHRQFKAWISLIQSLIEQNFVITSIYPVHSEMKTSTQIRGTASVGIDVIFVCRKLLTPPLTKPWDQILSEVKAEINEKLEILEDLSDEDLYVLRMGVILKYYTQYDIEEKDNEEKKSLIEVVETFSHSL
jgi:adenine-specific DNA methylase